MILLKQSTASQEVLLGPFLDSADGNTTEESLTIANTDIKIWKAGATTLADKNSGGATHISGGRYYAVLDATDTDTLGPLEIHVHVSGALAVRRECLVVTAAKYDLLTGATQNLQPLRAGTAQAGAASTITLDASASAVDDFYNGCIVAIISGTGAGQTNGIVDYVGSTKVATVGHTWITNPDNTSVFHVLPAAGEMPLFWGTPQLTEASIPKKSLGNAVMKSVHRTRDNAGSLETYRSDGVTTHSTQAITTDTNNAPIDELGGAA